MRVLKEFTFTFNSLYSKNLREVQRNEYEAFPDLFQHNYSRAEKPSMGKLCGFVYLLFRTSTRAAIYVSIIVGNSSKAYAQGMVIVWFVAFIINSLAAVAICKMLYNTVKHTRGRIENHDTTAEEMAKHEVGEFWFLLFLWLNFKSRCTFRNRAHAHAPHTFSRYAACRTNDELPEDRDSKHWSITHSHFQLSDRLREQNRDRYR